jgi:hypothetical protein
VRTEDVEKEKKRRNPLEEGGLGLYTRRAKSRVRAEPSRMTLDGDVDMARVSSAHDLSAPLSASSLPVLVSALAH